MGQNVGPPAAGVVGQNAGPPAGYLLICLTIDKNTAGNEYDTDMAEAQDASTAAATAVKEKVDGKVDERVSALETWLAEVEDKVLAAEGAEDKGAAALDAIAELQASFAEWMEDFGAPQGHPRGVGDRRFARRLHPSLTCTAPTLQAASSRTMT